MKEILVIGNSPTAKLNMIKNYDYVILGRAIFNFNSDVIEKWMTRYCFIRDAKRINVKKTYILDENYTDEYGIINPTLGYYAIFYFLNRNYKVNFTGITLDLNSKYMSVGSWWSKNEVRDNFRHNITKETIVLNKLKNNNEIFEL